MKCTQNCSMDEKAKQLFLSVSRKLSLTHIKWRFFRTSEALSLSLRRISFCKPLKSWVMRNLEEGMYQRLYDVLWRPFREGYLNPPSCYFFEEQFPRKEIKLAYIWGGLQESKCIGWDGSWTSWRFCYVLDTSLRGSSFFLFIWSNSICLGHVYVISNS